MVLEENLIKLFPESDWQPFLGHYVAVEINEDFLNKIREISKGPFNPEPPPPKTENYFKGENLFNLINDTAKDINKSDLFFVINIADYCNLIEYQRIEQTKEVDLITKRDVLATGLYATINQSPIYVNKK